MPIQLMQGGCGSQEEAIEGEAGRQTAGWGLTSSPLASQGVCSQAKRE